MKCKSILWIFSVALILAGCSSQSESCLNGYVEGEFVYVAPSSSGILKELSVMRGDRVGEGTPLFSLDRVQLQASVEAAKLEVAAATASWQDLCKGSRPEEIEVIVHQLDELKTVLANEEKEYKRSQDLNKESVISNSSFDAREMTYKVAQARIAELESKLAVARLGGREDALQAALNRVEIARQKVIQAEKYLAESAPQSLGNATVEDTYYRPGEFVQAGAPVVCLLPPENVKIRFFVPQNKIPTISLGTRVTVRCDGVPEDIAATVRFISQEVEFTPPVIYSTQSREKLCFLVEAYPEVHNSCLRPGLPVDIFLK